VRSLVLSAYLLFARNASGIAWRTLNKRLARGKEDADRLGERMGVAGLPRPDGRLMWIHAASVGESLSILELARRLLDERPDLHCVITTGTVTSAKALEGRMPARMVHQYIPLDVVPAVDGFLDHWKPDLAVWTESELWPALLDGVGRRGIPLVLVNARMSEKSYKRWRWWRGTAAAILGNFDYAMAQDEATARYLQGLGMPADKVEIAGSLKEGSAPLPHDERMRKAFARAISGRAVWLAASTHPGEEAVVSAAHHQARRSFPELLLILAPRHPERGDEVAQLLREDGWSVSQRSKGQEIDGRTDVYLADTIGEMGLWYRLAPVTFLGGSLETIGGHNPFEPAALGSAILHGPHVFNFADAFTRLGAADACVGVPNGAALADELEKVLRPEQAALLATAAWEASSDGADVTDRVLKVLQSHLEEA